MTTYKFCDLSVESDLALGISTTRERRRRVTFTLSSNQPFASATLDWFDHRPVEANPWLSLAKLESGYLLRFPGLANFEVSADGGQICCYAPPSTPVDTVRHLFLDQVMPLVLSHQGRLVLHASAVLTPSGAVAFLGHTHMGKSTLAASFCRHGYPALTDDCLCVDVESDRLRVHPSYPGLRLWPDSRGAIFDSEPRGGPMAHYSEKTREGPENGQLEFRDRVADLRRLYVLASCEDVDRPNRISITPLSSVEIFQALVQCTCRLDTTDRRRLGEEFGRLTRVAGSLTACRLAFPRDFSDLSAVRAAVLEDLRGEDEA